MAVSAVLLLGAVPTSAFALVKEKPLDRAEVIRRAKTWAKTGVPYSQKRTLQGYRRDCSGFVSMAWDIPENLVTWRIPTVAKRIRKRDLKPGDVLLNPNGGPDQRHVVMFEKWVDKKKTRYWAIEATGQTGVDRTVRRVVKYPYRVGGTKYKPYRYVGMKGYYRKIPRNLQLPVKKYEGRVKVVRDAEMRARRAARIEKQNVKLRASKEAQAKRYAAKRRAELERAATGLRAAEPDRAGQAPAVTSVNPPDEVRGIDAVKQRVSELASLLRRLVGIGR